MSTNFTSGLNFSWPSKNETPPGWWDVVFAALTKLSAHDHNEGLGQGKAITLDSNSVTDANLRLRNNQALRARNVLNSADVNLLKLDATDQLHILQALYLDSTLAVTGNITSSALTLLSSTETLAASGAISVSKHLTVLNGSSLAMTLAAGSEGQIKYVVNIASTNATVTPAATTGANTVTLFQYGSAGWIYLSSEWRVFTTQQAVVTDDIQATTATSGTYTITAPTFTFNNAAGTTATFSAGVANQEVTVFNIGAGSVSLTITGRPGASDVFTIATSGVLRLKMINSVWQVISGVNTNPVNVTYA